MAVLSELRAKEQGANYCATRFSRLKQNDDSGLEQAGDVISRDQLGLREDPLHQELWRKSREDSGCHGNR